MSTSKNILYLNFTQLTPQSFLQDAPQRLQEAKGCQWKIDIINFLVDWYSVEGTSEVFTSGSTGIPKTISLEKKHMKASAKTTLDFFGLKPTDLALLCLPVKFIAGKMMIVRSVIGQLDLYCIEPTVNPFENLPQIDFAALSPAQVSSLLESKKGTSFLNNIRQLIVGGSFIPISLENSMHRLQSSIWHTYGMTETITHIALRKVNGEDASEWFTPIAGVELQLSDKDCLQINAPKIGVSNLTTNDRAEISSKGFRVLGRIDNVVNSGGIKLFPEEIEKKLEDVIKNPFFLTGIRDEKFGEILVLVIEKGASNNDEAEIMGLVKKFLSRFEIPKRVIFVEKIQMTANGKIVRKV